jgi:hypothetical protein
LVSWWPAEGNANDVYDGNSGTLHNGAGFGAGKVGQAFNLNGTDAFVSFAASSNLNVGISSGLSVECWISPNNVSRVQIISEWNDGAGNIGVHFYHSDPGIGGVGSLAANIMDTSGLTHIFASAPNLVTRSNFQHVALTYDKASGIGKLYYNGTLVATRNVGVFTPQTTYPLYFGTRVSGPAAVGSYFAGLMDEVSLYNRALTDSEVVAIYNAGSSGKCHPNQPPTAANLEAATIQNRTMAIPVEKILLKAFDPDGDLLTLESVSLTSTNGGTVVLSTLDVLYTPSANYIGADRFTFTVSDGRGGSASGFVLIQVRDPNQISGNMLPLTQIAGGYLVTFAGIPGQTYTLQRASFVTGPWTNLVQIAVGQGGIATYADTNAPPAGAYYRTTYP